VIYAVQCGASGPIKIGKAKDPQGRLGELQVGNWEKLNLLAYQTCSEDNWLERQLHSKYAQYKVRGEWFMPSEQILQLVERIKAGKAETDITQAQAKAIVADYNAHMEKYNLLRLLALLKRWVALSGKPVHQG
jgi:hypothetical protein